MKTKTYMCEMCDKPCIVILPWGSAEPNTCVYHEPFDPECAIDAEWHRVKDLPGFR